MQAHPPNPEDILVIAGLFSFADPVIQAFLAACAAVTLDWLAGILVAATGRAGTSFSLSYVSHQLVSMWLPYIGGLVVIAIVADLTKVYPGFIQGTGYVGLIASIVAVGVKALIDVAVKVQVLLGNTSTPAQPVPVQPTPAPLIAPR
jgi:hypothetical protein